MNIFYIIFVIILTYVLIRLACSNSFEHTELCRKIYEGRFIDLLENWDNNEAFYNSNSLIKVKNTIFCPFSFERSLCVVWDKGKKRIIICKYINDFNEVIHCFDVNSHTFITIDNNNNLN